MLPRHGLRLMRWNVSAIVLALGIVASILVPWLILPDEAERGSRLPATAVSARGEAADRPIQPIPLRAEMDARKVALGDRLFHERRLSGDDTIACASCHPLDRGGTDGQVRSRGVGGRDGAINTPTVFNAALNFRQFWDGRASSLADQVSGPVQNPVEMNSSWAAIVGKLTRDPGYVSAFASIYPEGIQSHTVVDAIVAFERSLLTPNSRFDRFLRGDRAALTEQELAGYGLFKSYGCVACHQGVNVGGNMYQRFGVMADYFSERQAVTKADLGRFNVTGVERDRHSFKVPTLRNIARTAPYFHDGSATTLPEAVSIMARYQLGRAMSPGDIDLIVKFLHTLTGEYRGRPL